MSKNQLKFMRLIFSLLIVFVISGCSTMPSVDSLTEFHSREVRLDTITRNIVSRNIDLCPDQRKDYGFKAMWLLQEQSEESNSIYRDAYGLSQQPTITTVIPNAPFDRSEIKVGEVIFSINGNRWSELPEDRTQLIDELISAQKEPSMRIGLEKKKKGQAEIEVLIVGDDVCSAYVALVDNPGTYAYAYAYHQMAYIESGLLDLLNDDDELAFIVAHEIAHVILKHFGPDKENDFSNKELRALNEKEADEMSIQLMINAGYDPSGAYTAIRKVDRSNRGSITRLLGLYGVYMPTEERVEFLKARAENVSE